MNDQHVVLTPEKVIVVYRLSTVGSRISAHLTDLLLCTALMITVSLLLSLFARFVSPVLAEAIGIIVIAFGVFAYFILQEGLWQGQTLGKKAAGIRVMMADGTPVTFKAALFRNLLRPADFLPSFYMLGIVAMFTNERAQRIGDLAAGTIVIHEPKQKQQFSIAPHRYGVHPLENTVGDLRKMTMEEYFAIKRLCDRFPELPPPAQLRSLAEVWEPFAASQGIQPIPNVHPVYQMEAVVMLFSRQHHLI